MTTSIYVMGDRSTEVSHPAHRRTDAKNRQWHGIDEAGLTLPTVYY